MSVSASILFLYIFKVKNLFMWLLTSGRDGGNRTHIGGFGDRSPTIERRPYKYFQSMEPGERIELSTSSLPWKRSAAELPRQPLHRKEKWCRGRDSNPRRRKPADLQSAPVGHFGTSAYVGILSFKIV